MDLGYLVAVDPIYRQLCKYLDTRERIKLQDISKDIRKNVIENPSTWKHLDLTGRSSPVITHYLSADVIPGALQELILDCSDVNEMDLCAILLRCPNLRVLGLGGCTELMNGVLQAVIVNRQNGVAQKLRFVGLLGAPFFKTTGVSANAASVTRDLKQCGLQTDLIKCPQGHAFTSEPEEHWHLCTASISKCATCGKRALGCYPCLNGRTCRGCFKFWCHDCESPISRVCYECGHSCTSCKQGIYVKCSECASMFCKLHRDDPQPTSSSSISQSGRTQTSQLKAHNLVSEDTCDWCISGKATAFRERFRC